MVDVRNWSGSVRFRAAEEARPASTDDVVGLVRQAAASGRTLRPVGAGHSSSELAVTPDVVLSTDRLRGVVAHDVDRGLATLRPGTGLREANDALADVGLGLETMGDVDLQAIAGALGTGTHGSGSLLPNLSALLVGAQLVTGTGAVVRVGKDAGDPAAADVLPDGVGADDLLRSARLSLGALGVLTSLTLRVVPAFELHRRDWCTHVDWAIEHYDELARTNRAFDMYWYPRSDQAQVRTLNLPGTGPALVPPGGHLHGEEVGPSHRVIPKQRHLPFDEMEYMLPYDAGLECFRQVRQRVREIHRRAVAWRVLVRTVAADDTPLSNCYGRPTMTIALLHNAGMPYEDYFFDVEPILRSYGGRPHWGKKHTMTATDLRPLFPEWEVFQEVRRALDPDQVFLNDHLRTLLEEDS